MIIRKACILCSHSLIDIYTFKDFPVYMGISNSSISKDIVEDMIFSECKNCGCVQLRNLIDLNILYATPHNSAIGKMWDEHHRSFFEFIKTYTRGTIIEIGGGNLKLSKLLAQVPHIDKIIIFETNLYDTNIPDKIIHKKEFFDATLITHPVNTIVHSHVLEHFYNPLDKLNEMSKILNNGSYMAMAVPLIDRMLKDNFTNAMNFEHTYMTSFNLIENLLNMNQFEIVKTKDFSQYITFFIVRKNSNIPKKKLGSYKDNTSIFNKFVRFHEHYVKEIEMKLIHNKENTFIFGAHIFTQYLFGFGLNMNLFTNILDNDENKIGRRLSGTNLVVKSPKVLKNIAHPVIVLRAAQYNEEIKKDILRNINPNTEFIE